VSAGGVATGVHRDLDECAPKFAAAVRAGVQACRAHGLDAIVWEAYRTPELQLVYWHRGRPPTTEYPGPVTWAKSNLYSWHGYGLAVDVISECKHWKAGDAWFAAVAEEMKQHALDWGGDWKHRPDGPHFQWGTLKPTPSDRARALIQPGSTLAAQMQLVWREVGAI
jgi:peptidoglycan L-alanyl-D-glutamate endopeptidase CwlK